MSENLVTIDILDEASLLEACDILHDSRFNLSTLEFDENKGIRVRGLDKIKIYFSVESSL